MPREENEAEEIKGMIGGLVLLGLVCAFVLAMTRSASDGPEAYDHVSSVEERGAQSN